MNTNFQIICVLTLLLRIELAYSQVSNISSCSDSVRISYQSNVSKIHITTDSFLVYLNSGFDDRAIITLNDSIIYDGYVRTNPVLSNAMVLCVNLTTGKHLQLKINLSDRCLVFFLNKKYKYINVSLWKGTWYVFHTNKKPLFE